MIVKILTFNINLGLIERIFEAKKLVKNERWIMVFGESDLDDEVYNHSSRGYLNDNKDKEDVEQLRNINVILNGEEQNFYDIEHDYIDN